VRATHAMVRAGRATLVAQCAALALMASPALADISSTGLANCNAHGAAGASDAGPRPPNADQSGRKVG
jgi:hypothetical protein